MMEQPLGKMGSCFLSVVFLKLKGSFSVFLPTPVQSLINTTRGINVSVSIWRFYLHHPLIPVYLWFYRFYLKEFRGSRKWLLFLEGEYLKTHLFNLVLEGQLVLARRPHWNFDGDVISSGHLQFLSFFGSRLSL